jgi:rhodanese-related sulfurtransferase
MPVPRITKEELKQRLDSTEPAERPIVIDVRLKYPYEHSAVKLPGALRVSPKTLDTTAIPRAQDVVAYDSDPGEIVSSRVAAELIRQGFRASALKGGIAEWMAANYPVETKEGSRPAPPQTGTAKGS